MIWNGFGTAFGGARGRTDVPKNMNGKIDIDPMTTHTMPLEKNQRRLRPDA